MQTTERMENHLSSGNVLSAFSCSHVAWHEAVCFTSLSLNILSPHNSAGPGHSCLWHLRRSWGSSHLSSLSYLIGRVRCYKNYKFAKTKVGSLCLKSKSVQSASIQTNDPVFQDIFLQTDQSRVSLRSENGIVWASASCHQSRNNFVCQIIAWYIFHLPVKLFFQ